LNNFAGISLRGASIFRAEIRPILPEPDNAGVGKWIRTIPVFILLG